MALNFRRFRANQAVRPTAVVAVAMLCLGACQADGAEQVVELSAPSGSPASTDPRDQLRQLELVRSGTILAERTARGVSEPAEFATDGSYAFRAVCSGGGRLTVRTHISREHDVSIECRGLTSGMRFLNESDVEVWSVRATDRQEWSIVWVDWDGEGS